MMTLLKPQVFYSNSMPEALQHYFRIRLMSINRLGYYCGFQPITVIPKGTFAYRNMSISYWSINNFLRKDKSFVFVIEKM